MTQLIKSLRVRMEALATKALFVRDHRRWLEGNNFLSWEDECAAADAAHARVVLDLLEGRTTLEDEAKKILVRPDPR